MISNGTIAFDNVELPRYLAKPSGRDEPLPALIMCHSFPFGPIDARHSAKTFPELIDRMANELGFAAMSFTFRGCGESSGDFSLQGWVDDLRAAIDHMIEHTQPTGLWLVGSNTGGSLAICVAADDPRVKGCALLGVRADFDDWAAQPRRFLEHCRSVGAVRTPRFPVDFDEWTRELRRFRPVNAAGRFAPRPLLLLHGDDDESVPPSDTRQLAEAHGSAEMRVIDGAGHRLRHDPRAIAVLFGWLDRQRLSDD